MTVAMAPASTPTMPLGEELRADLAHGRAEGAAEADLRAAFQHRDDHDVGDADGADDQGHDAEAEEEAVERSGRGGAGGERVGGLADVDLVGGLWLAVGASSACTSATWSVSAHVD